MVQKVLLFLAVVTSLITVYFCFGQEADITVFSLFGLKYGINVNDHTGWKLASVAFWGLLILAREIKDEGNNNSDSIGNTNNRV